MSVCICVYEGENVPKTYAHAYGRRSNERQMTMTTRDLTFLSGTVQGTGTFLRGSALQEQLKSKGKGWEGREGREGKFLPFSSLPFPSLPVPSLPFSPFPYLPFPSRPFPSPLLSFPFLSFPSLPFPSLPFPPTLQVQLIARGSKRKKAGKSKKWKEMNKGELKGKH